MRTLLRLMMALYIPFLVLFWMVLGGLILLLGYGLTKVVFFPYIFVLLIIWLGFTLVQTLWAARLLIQPLPRDDDPLELKVPAEGVAEIHELTKKVAAERRLPKPHEVRLSAGTVAHVYEDDEGRRILVLGGVALTMLSERALAGIIAHELGHFGAGDTALMRAGFKRACLMMLLESCFANQHWVRWNPLVWFVRGYHWLYLLVRAKHSREGEFAADRHDAAQAGKEETAAALVFLDVLDELPWTRWTSVAESHAATGQPLEELFAEQRLRARSISRGDWEEAMRKALAKETHVLDSHPCLRERLRAVAVSPKKALGYALERMGAPLADRLRAWPGIEKRLTQRVMVLAHQAQQEKMEWAQIIMGPR